MMNKVILPQFIIRENGTNSGVDSDNRMLTIIEALKERTSAGVTELANAVEIKSTVHVHLSTLKEQGYVVQDESHEYRLSLRFLDMGMTIRQTQDMYDEIIPKLNQLAEETEEKAWWTVEENGKAVFIAKAVGSSAIRTNATLGSMSNSIDWLRGRQSWRTSPEERKTRLSTDTTFRSPTEASRGPGTGTVRDPRSRRRIRY